MFFLFYLFCFVLFSVEENCVGVGLLRAQGIEEMENGLTEIIRLSVFYYFIFFLFLGLRFRLNKPVAVKQNG